MRKGYFTTASSSKNEINPSTCTQYIVNLNFVVEDFSGSIRSMCEQSGLRSYCPAAQSSRELGVN